MPDVGGGGSVGRSEHSVSLTGCELKTNERISGIKVGVADLKWIKRPELPHSVGMHVRDARQSIRRVTRT